MRKLSGEELFLGGFAVFLFLFVLTILGMTFTMTVSPDEAERRNAEIETGEYSLLNDGEIDCGACSFR